MFLLLLPIAAYKDVQRQKELKYGRRLKGPEMLTPKQFNTTVKGDGVGFKTNDMKPMLRVPYRAEAQHMQIIGDTGAGKSALMFQVLRQVKSRGDAAIVLVGRGHRPAHRLRELGAEIARQGEIRKFLRRI